MVTPCSWGRGALARDAAQGGGEAAAEVRDDGRGEIGDAEPGEDLAIHLLEHALSGKGILRKAVEAEMHVEAARPGRVVGAGFFVVALDGDFGFRMGQLSVLRAVVSPCFHRDAESARDTSHDNLG